MRCYFFVSVVLVCRVGLSGCRAVGLSGASGVSGVSEGYLGVVICFRFAYNRSIKGIAVSAVVPRLLG